MSNVLAAHIQKNARFLKLSTLPAIYTQLAEKAVKSKLSYEEFLAILLEQEVAKKRTPPFNGGSLVPNFHSSKPFRTSTLNFSLL